MSGLFTDLQEVLQPALKIEPFTSGRKVKPGIADVERISITLLDRHHGEIYKGP
jgi:hypothetical protein